MNEQLNRLTANFSLSLQEQSNQFPHPSQSRWHLFSTALAQAADHLEASALASLDVRVSPYLDCFSVPFLQLGQAAGKPSPRIPMPAIEAARDETEAEGFSWSSFWEGLGAVLTQSLEGAIGSLIHSLSHILESQPGKLQFILPPSVTWVSLSHFHSPYPLVPYPFVGEGRLAATFPLSHVLREEVLAVRESSVANLRGSLLVTPIASTTSPASLPKLSSSLSSSVTLTESVPPAIAKGSTAPPLNPLATQLSQSLTETISQRQPRDLSLRFSRAIMASLTRTDEGEGLATPRSAVAASTALLSSSQPFLVSQFSRQFEQLRWVGTQLSQSLTENPLDITNASVLKPASTQVRTYRPPAIEQILQSQAASRSPPQSQVSTVSSATSAPLTFQGGIHVQIVAQTIDREHAEETARAIAAQVLREIDRLTERDRFRRGLPTSSIL